MFTTDQIRHLISTNNLSRFYTSRAWKRVAKQVRQEQHNECQICKANGKYTKADVVHHVNHVRSHPDLAYSKTYTDTNGRVCPQLVCLCHNCHEHIHNRRYNSRKNKKGFLNSERW